MTRILGPVLRRLMSLTAVVLVMAAVLITLVRLGLPLAGQMRDDLAALLSERLGQPVQIDRLTLRLNGLTPRLVLDGVSLGRAPDGGALLALRAMELDLDPGATLLDRRARFTAVTLVGLHLELRRLADGGVRISGLDLLQGGDPGAMEHFLDDGRLNLIDADLVLVDDGSDRPLAWLTDLRLQLQSQGSRHRAVGFARPVPTLGPRADSISPARLRLIADLRGPAATPATWEGMLYVSLQGQDLDALVPADWRRGIALETGSVLMESWVRVVAARPVDVLSRVTLRGLDLPLARVGPDRGRKAASGRLRVDRLAGTFRALSHEAGWSLGARDLVLSLDGRDRPSLSFDLDLDRSGATRRLALVAESFDLSVAAELLPVTGQPLPAPLQRLVSMYPRGRLDRLGVVLELPRDGQPRWRLATRVSALGLDRSGRIPGVGGLDVLVRADQSGGLLGLGSDSLDLDLAPLFDAPIHLDQLSGRLRWERDTDGTVHIEAPALAVQNADLSGHACLGLTLPAAGSPSIDLRASFLDGDGAHTRTYLPVGKMHPSLVGWLERAIVDGWVPEARLVLSGPLDRFPFRDGDGRFELSLELEDVLLDYREGWPPLQDAAGTLRFVDEAMEIELSSGRILDSRLHRARATLADRRHSALLEIDGETVGPLSDGLRLLAETPLSEKLGPLARVLEVDGDSRLSLHLAVPLKDEARLGVDGRVNFSRSAQVGLAGTPVVLRELDGTLAFTMDSINAEPISARLWGRPLTLGLQTLRSGETAEASTEVRVRTGLPVSLLAERFPSPAWRLAAGSLDLDLGARLCNADLGRTDPPIGFDLRSDLSGLALDLPAPLGKTTGARRSLRLAGSVVPHRSLEATGRVGDLGVALGLDLAAQPVTLTDGRVHFGGPDAAPEPGRRGVLIDGRVQRLMLGEWMEWWERVGPGLSGAGSAPGSGWPSIETDLGVGELGLGEVTLHEARIQSVASRPVRVSVDAAELAGRVTLPVAGSGLPLDLALERLDLAAATAHLREDREGNARPGTGGDAIRLPAMDLRVDDLRWGDAGLGRLKLELRRDRGEVRVPTLVFNGIGQTTIDGEARWPDADGAGNGHLALSLESDDPAPLLDALDYENAIREAPVEALVDISWPGGLGGFSGPRASGTISFRTGAGRLLEVEPGVGRLLGFLNLSALTRRLSLDFSDLYGEGFAFERIDGEIALGAGKARLERFEIDGPAGAIRIAGSTDLEARTFDQIVTVEPSIGTGVALAGAVAGGPVVGAAVFLVDKASGGAFDRLASYRYRVTGPWSRPTLTRMGWSPFRGIGDTPDRAGSADGRTPAGDADGRQEETNYFLD